MDSQISGTSLADVFKTRTMFEVRPLYHMEHLGGAGGRKQRLGQHNKAELLQVGAGAAIEAGDPLARLGVYHL